jgi:stage II sporulation protein D
VYFALYSISNLKKTKSKFKLFLLLTYILFLVFACSSSKRFTNINNSSNFTESSLIRVLLEEKSNDLIFNVGSQIYLSDLNKRLAKINAGNKIFVQQINNKLQISIADKIFSSDTFFITCVNEDAFVKLNGNNYRGRIKVFLIDSQIKVVNQIGLESYVKGVMTKEMPLGKGKENYEALKAFSICIRTYALLKIFENKKYFDIYPDTRDQVYGGVDAENTYSSSIVDETLGQILSYNGSPAVIFYHAACGGYTEDVNNVFSNNKLPYLVTVQDGSEPYCGIAPKFNWTEEYSNATFISRLFDSRLIPSKNYKLIDLKIVSRFESGRVNELRITLIDNLRNEKNVSLFGNNIRYVIKTSNGKSILKSTMIDITFAKDRSVLISGKGNGHGVGLCQWGAIGQSQKGIDYLSILNHYFPGTKVINYYD